MPFVTPQLVDAPQGAVPPGELPASVEAAVWRGDQLGAMVGRVVATGFTQLDAQLPGGGWPCNSVTEILAAQYSTLEWRLLAPALRRICEAGRSVVVVGPPRQPHLPGLRHEGIDDRHLVWVQAATPSERLWSTEQLIKSKACGAVIAWVPQARQEQIRRLQVLAGQCDGPVFLCRPSLASQESSAAPLRLLARVGLDWELQVELIKRKGPSLETTLRLPSVPGGLQFVLSPRMRFPSRWWSQQEARDVVVGAPSFALRRHTAAH